MARTHTNLYRSIEGDQFGAITVGIYPGDGILDPCWEAKSRYSSALRCMVAGCAEATVVLGNTNPEILEGSGPLLRDVPGWWPVREFWIPEGTEYSDELLIRKDKERQVCPGQPALEGHQYRIEPRTRMPLLAFRRHLDNFARAAVARQRELIGQR
ncbi:Tse2 family ADP-ribosyltransferase toxin [Azohydromonas aeria]|uniref:Tse2 family ADP-ribosyltransferase toxin n=1 Tax=Azohydromonas aeria TaxID=2590212 RepID=UPI0012F81639|nr:hypothetical protein [Azohydromonas aeria]